ncbi:fibronectin type III domain protein [Opisthorchis viverrini]|uniref:Fibronectin type III domain protein n=1 Tax=Opisthorchis viverrini TaxID=6198 RepID=A0A1S8X8X7_OPIVI|nr:fibronectin type III domain protein [Opisthorchis viverrini]
MTKFRPGWDTVIDKVGRVQKRQPPFGATYQFEVSLLNASVTGPSARLNVTTPDAPPSTSPLHVRLSGLSSSAVEISWAPPPVQYRNGRITAYQVRYFEVGAETQTETMAKVTVPGQRQHTAKDLKEKTFYTFMVRAFTSAGPGPWSGASNIRTSVERKSLLNLVHKQTSKRSKHNG